MHVIMDEMGLCFINYFLFLIATCNCCDQGFPEVQTTTALYRGIRQWTPTDNFPHESFLGVQYADFTERFQKASYPPKSYTGIFNATKLGSRCHQLEQYEFPFEQEDAEDCLNLNIYVPWGVKCLGSRKLSVVVAIHGGGYEYGTTAHIAGGAILEVVRDVIFISIGYRLGPWGLLTTGDDIAPGNLLYWDQHYALRWIHDNIEHFGGNPDEVTLWGYSAGGTSVGAQALFPGNKGLIKRVIPVSGCGFSHFMAISSCKERNITLERTKRLAQVLGCPKQPSWALVHCLQKVENKKILQVANSPQVIDDVVIEDRWNPIIDGVFLEDVPYQLHKQKRAADIEYMHGFGTHDIGHFLSKYQDVPQGEEEIEKFWKDFFRSIDLEDFITDAYHIEHRYGSNLHPASERTSELFTDRLMAFSHLQELKYHQIFTSATNDYLYTFNHRPSFSTTADWLKGGHVDIIVFGFGIILSYPDVFPTTKAEKQLSRDMLRYQFNFAKTGNPNVGSGVPTLFPQWDIETRRLLRFTSTADCGYSVDSDAYKGVEEFWEPYVLHNKITDRENFCVDP